MKYIYVFDYSFDHIYQITIDKKEFDNIKNMDIWLFRNYRISYRTSAYMISDKKLEIETIEKV